MSAAVRCALSVLAWAIGLPAALSAFLAALLGYLYLCGWAAMLLGYSDLVGAICALGSLCAMFGAAVGLAICREGR